MPSIPHIAAAVAASLACAAPIAAQSFHFENGNLSGWLQGGTAFRSQPTFGNNVAPRRPGESPEQDGDWWIGTYEDRNGPSQPLGRVQGDEPQGTLISPLFVISNNNISLLVGGGNDPANLRVDLVVEPAPGETIDSDGSHYGSAVMVPEGQFVVRRTATGRDEERMRRVQWDTRSMIGRRARMMIVDNSSAPWGHINVDDVRPGSAIVADATPPMGYVVTQPPVAYPVGGGPVVVHPAPPQGPGQRVEPPVAMPMPGGSMPGGMPPRLGESGHFRVVVTGFRVNRQSDDDALQRDGVGDEIFIRGDTFFLTHGRTRFTSSSARTGMYGQGGLPGGSAGALWGSAGEESGGLLTGDFVPRNDLFGTAPARVTGRLPLVLFDGLINRTKEIVIVPSIWEWDGAFDGPAKDDFDRDVPAQTIFNVRALPLPLATYSDEHGLPLVESLAAPLNVFDEGTRPIGAATRGSARFGTMRLPAIVLNLDTALEAARKQFEDHTPIPVPSGATVPPVSPLPPGVIPIQMSDIDGRAGYYTLYVRIQHLID